MITSVSLLIPAFNEEKRLPSTLRSIAEWISSVQSDLIREILVIDDGSSDETAACALSFQSVLPLRVISLPKNEGKGAALKAGLREVHSPWVLFLDADGATPIAELRKLLQKQEETASLIIIGSRVLDASASITMSRSRRIVGKIYHAVTAPLIPGIRDASCGFKLLKTDTARDLFSAVHDAGYGYDVELLALARVRRISVQEVQVQWTEIPGSKVHVVRDGIRMFSSACLLFVRFLFRM